LVIAWQLLFGRDGFFFWTSLPIMVVSIPVMKRRSFPRLIGAVLVHGLLLAFACNATAQKIWTSPSSGFWGDTNNWSGHSAPIDTSSVIISNANTKTVTIDAATPAANLTIASLKLSAPGGSTNTLLLSNAGTNNPLYLFNGLTMSPGGAMHITNSAVTVDNSVNFIDIDGSVTMDGGLITFGDITSTTKVGVASSGIFTINSGSVSTGRLKVGADLTNALGVLKLNGGGLEVSLEFSAGHSLGTTGVVSVLGGHLIVTNDDTRIGDAGVGQMTVSNATLLLTNLIIAHDSFSLGTLTLQSGAEIQVLNNISVGRFPGATGAVFMAGGQLSAPGQTLYVGREGAGQMTISNGSVQAASAQIAAVPTNTASGVLTVSGGSLSMSSNFLVGSSMSTGQVLVTGGTISAANSAGAGSMSILSGNLTLSGGSVSTDSLLLTNSAGTFAFNTGILNVKNATVANGSPFIVGNGVAPAVFNMTGGTNTFVNGLTISSNAILVGCGTIIGTITNHGTIATNCGVALVRPTITAQAKSGTTNRISFTSVGGQTYFVEYKSSLSDMGWTAILPWVSGSGSVLTATDAVATATDRFYRVRTQ
jgi:T5SS/PEP-CTERM-associated repeat protein